MAKNRIKLCWLLLLMLMYTTSILLSVAPAQARYNNTVTGHSLVEARPYGMSSDCMVSKGEPALTVLVGELPLVDNRSTEVSFWLKSSGADAAGKLAWSVQNPEHRQYLKIDMYAGPETIDPEMEIGLLKDVPMEFSMSLTPTPIACNVAHEQLKINVLVTWGQEMWGTFQVILPAKEEVVPEETTPDESEDPEAPENTEGTEQAPGDDGDGTIEETENTDTGSGENQGIITEELEVQSTGITDDDEGLDEYDTINNETIENEDGTGDDAVDNTDDGVGDITEDGTEEDNEEDTEGETTLAPIRMETISRFAPTEKLPLKITVTEDITAIRLGLEASAEDEVWIEKFPDNTRFSLNQGEGYYMMYDGNVLDLRPQNGLTSLSVLLDFSDTKLAKAEKLTLMMEAYAGETPVKTCSVVTFSDALDSCVTRLHPLNAETGMVVYTIEPVMASEEETTQVKNIGWESRVLSKDNALEFALPMEWLDAELEYSVEMLTMTEHQTLEYRPVTLSASGLSGRYTDYDLTHNLMFKVGENLPPAGTYRLNMKWSYEGICFAQTQTTFFINYAAQSAYALGSQEASS